MLIVGIYCVLGVGVALGLIRSSGNKDPVARTIVGIVWGLLWPVFIMALITGKLIDG